MPLLSTEQLHGLLRAQEARESERRERIRNAVVATPAPLPPELVQAVIRLNGSDAREIMQGHTGFEMAERRASYRTSLDIMELCASDLLKAIDDFAAQALAQSTNLFDPHEEERLQAIELRIQKELFAAADGAASLVDHSRRMLKLLDLPAHAEQLRSCFGDDGLHEFMIALRVLLHHLHMVEAGWNLQRSYAEGTASATFAINKDTLLRVIPRHKLTKRELVLRYVASLPASIDLVAVFTEYMRRVTLFHEWFCRQLESRSLVALQDYDRIMQEKKKYDTRMW